MSTALPSTDVLPRKPVEYPDSDGMPMADNPEQFEFITTFKANLDWALPDFVAGDHLWYPVEGDPETRIAPDVYVALGRPKGYRGSYKMWEEGGIPPRVVFEWWSPRTSLRHIYHKIKFYEKFGVDEFYTFDQDSRDLTAFVREVDGLNPTATEGGFVSPLLGIRIDVVDGQFKAWHRDGRPFLSWAELKVERDHAEQERQRAEQERQRAEQERDQARDEVAVLRKRLRTLGIEP